jgi:hypothetical protein
MAGQSLRMATDYVILTPPEGQEGPFQSILTTGGEPVAFQVPLKWTERIVIALKLLDAHEKEESEE